MATINWMIDQIPDTETDLGVGILEHILIGTPASPLHKALVDLGLGEDIAGRGLDDELLQPMFSVGLKGIDPSSAERVEALVLETLRALADEGVDRMTVEASLNTIEFRLRENNFGSFPRGIAAMLRSKTWRSTALERAGLPVALACRSLRVPGRAPEDVRRALGDVEARVADAPATLEERFFELTLSTSRTGVPLVTRRRGRVPPGRTGSLGRPRPPEPAGPRGRAGPPGAGRATAAPGRRSWPRPANGLPLTATTPRPSGRSPPMPR